MGDPIQKQINPNLKYDIAPSCRRRDHRHVVRGSLNTVTTQAQNKEAAWKFTAGCPAPRASRCGRAGPGTSRRDGCGRAAVFKENKLPRRSSSRCSLPNAKTPYLGMPHAVQLNKILTTECRTPCRRRRRSKQALDDAAAEWNKILAKYRSSLAREPRARPAATVTEATGSRSARAALTRPARASPPARTSRRTRSWRRRSSCSVALMVYPLAQVVRMSFFEVTSSRKRWVGLGNYVRALARAAPSGRRCGRRSCSPRAAWSPPPDRPRPRAPAPRADHARLRSLIRGLLILPWLLAPTVAGMIWALMLPVRRAQRRPDVARAPRRRTRPSTGSASPGTSLAFGHARSMSGARSRSSW